MIKEEKFAPNYIIPPGYTLADTLEETGMSQKELADRTGRPEKTISEIINGKTAITPETALQFEKALGIPANFWNKLEQNYKNKLALKKENEQLENSIHLLEKVPVSEMIKKNWIDKKEDQLDQVRELLNFFGVASFDAWQNIWQANPSFRQSEAYKIDHGAIVSWLRKGEIESHKVECNPFDKEKFKEALIEIRTLTKEPIDISIPKTKELCSQAGVAVVFVPELTGCRSSGATYWTNKNKAVIQLSARYKRDDHLWFTFFHEAGHILNSNKKNVFIEYDDIDCEEKQANRFASEFLIPHERLKEFINNNAPFISKANVKEFAKELEIATGIVVGRLQYEKYIKFSQMNDLKTEINLEN